MCKVSKPFTSSLQYTQNVGSEKLDQLLARYSVTCVADISHTFAMLTESLETQKTTQDIGESRRLQNVLYLFACFMLI